MVKEWEKSMNQITELLIHYCKAANIALISEDKNIDVSKIFNYAFNKGFLKNETYNQLRALMEGR